MDYLWRSGISMHTPCACGSTPYSIWQSSQMSLKTDCSNNDITPISIMEGLTSSLLMYILSWTSSNDLLSLLLTSKKMRWMVFDRYSSKAKGNLIDYQYNDFFKPALNSFVLNSKL